MKKVKCNLFLVLIRIVATAQEEPKIHQSMKLAIFTTSLRLRTLLTGLIVICNFSFGQIKVSSDGKIGIGTLTPSVDLEIDASQIIMKNGSSNANLRIQYLYGNSVIVEPTENNNGYLGYNNYWMQLKARQIYSYYDYSYSDSRIKEGVRDLDNSLSKVLQMNAVKYKLKPKYSTKEEYLGKKEKRNEIIGFIAQDLMDIVPEVVSYDSTAQLYAVSYSRIIPVLVEAIKEMHEEFESLQTELDDLRLKVEDIIEKEFAELQNSTPTGSELTPENGGAILEQNHPNPFSENTSIAYYLESTIQQAALYIYDIQGKQIKNMDISDRENGNIVIYANELNPGIYYYSLIADGKRIGTRQMILTD